ncbi:MAG: protein TolQ, partial [Candidatus Aminicenantes bacterium]|nr:protein TolQ [Candidatus Aminicenantes bacterium]
MNFVQLIIKASIVVQIVLVVLLFFSVFSWAIIYYKRKSFKTAERESERFMSVFKKSRNLAEVNNASQKYKSSPLASLFRSGFKALAYTKKSNPESSLSPQHLESINRALIKASNKEVKKLEKMMSFLATTGSVTPFIGLFGTVWGIMDSFIGLAITKTASISTVAPGIAEALVATALGLFAAIPAVIAYNHFLQKIKEN